MFNINQNILNQIKDAVDACGTVYVHGDGVMFAKEKGSNHHKEYNSGADAGEALNRASYRAVFKKGDNLPNSESELEAAFYEQRKIDLKNQNTPKVETSGDQVYLTKKQEAIPESLQKSKVNLNEKFKK